MSEISEAIERKNIKDKEILRKKLIEDMRILAQAPCGNGQIFFKDAKEKINTRLGVKEDE